MSRTLVVRAPIRKSRTSASASSSADACPAIGADRACVEQLDDSAITASTPIISRLRNRIRVFRSGGGAGQSFAFLPASVNKKGSASCGTVANPLPDNDTYRVTAVFTNDVRGR